jgi:hypothetical protein
MSAESSTLVNATSELRLAVESKNAIVEKRRMFMPAEHVSDLKFEIGHVLFIDIVGYSTLLINEQS